ncbi:MAG TPA: single-stranded-DNA-specific exonuclease RecJ, partial [Planctomycetota bacterium]|nr:single-stranded-DNA-specific exonuclease RecJ [Planctomycetota bacterium]
MNKKYRWLVKATNYEAIQQLQKDFLFTEEFCKILASRGLIHKEEVHSFLNPSWDNIHHYNKFNQMEQAVARIATAIQNKEKIVIYGDYDADGITATALLYQCFCLFDANIYYYIPERNEGYGVNKTAIKK